MREVNRLQEMEVFLAVMEEGSFSAAAVRRQMTPSAVSKMMTRLETRLGATLLRRTTRRVQVTDEGQAFARSARGVLAALDQAEREVGGGPVAGLVRIATSSAYANYILAPMLPRLLRAHPELDLELIVGDGITDMAGQPVDLAIRAGPLPDSTLQARSLGTTEVLTVRAPGAVAAQVGFAYPRRDPLWHGDTPRVRANDGATVTALAASGCGTARAGAFMLREALASGTLETVPGSAIGQEQFHVVYLGKATTLPARITAVVEFLTRNGRVDT
ncbi:LysR family transcriptional regulator [Pseudodonghicola xiamenensis]|uniref:LysR family transcriptional regulator n=1 Tax=Pseudodonghicola xiamenensis TaxID=337702 RepID=A0A8J3H6N1_9RHOB|nr:LysR family transcriptional regulator [Pseudodonghicola xiamenensis]GHG85252.1 LysR family transcriptional regulator [Pseudodonghicola xiamenensis]